MDTLPDDPSQAQYRPRILFIGGQDHANLSNRIARGINAYAGQIIARVWTLIRHPFQYPEDLIGPPPEVESDLPAGLYQWVRGGDLDWVITTGDGAYDVLEQMFEALRVIEAKAGELAVTHSGSAFREQPAMYCEADFQLGAKVRFVGFDSLGLTIAHEHPDHAIPTYPYWPSYDPARLIQPAPLIPGAKLIVSHSPSRRETKGTSIVLDVMDRITASRNDVEFDLIEGVTASWAIERRARSHIFIDQINSGVGGFGASAVEAMASGCAVVGDARNVPLAGWDGCVPPIMNAFADGPAALYDRVCQLLDDPYELSQRRSAAFEWARVYASPKFVGERFLKILQAHK